MDESTFFGCGNFGEVYKGYLKTAAKSPTESYPAGKTVAVKILQGMQISLQDIHACVHTYLCIYMHIYTRIHACIRTYIDTLVLYLMLSRTWYAQNLRTA